MSRGGKGQKEFSKPWDFTIRMDEYGPRVVPTSPSHYPPDFEFDEITGLSVPPPPPPNGTPRGEQEDDEDVYGFPIGEPRRMTVTARQIVNRMSIIEAFSDAVTRTHRPHAVTKDKAPPNHEATFATYIPFSFDFGIVPDPETIKLTWVQKAADTLYYLLPVALIVTSILSSIALFGTVFLDDLYVKKMLRIILKEDPYVNIFGFIGAHLGIVILVVVFLCYPNRSEWGRFHQMRWILVGVVNMVLVVGVLDQFYWVVNFQELGHQLREIMAEDLDVTTVTTLSRSSQFFFRCCGVDGYKDWEPILKNNRSLYYGGFPKTCCSDDYERSCSVPVLTKVIEGSGLWYNQLWSTGCYEDEFYLLKVTACLIWIVMLIIALTSICKSLFLWWIIRNINAHNLTIDHPFRH